MLTKTFLALILSITTLVCHADESTYDSTEDLLYACDAKNSHVFIGRSSADNEFELDNQSQLDHLTERIATADLVTYSPEDEHGFIYRTGSETIKRECGIFVISIQRWFLNSNPNGELGGTDFPLVTVTAKMSKKPIQIRIGSCDANIPRYNECPANWATSFHALFI